jgi:O-succinylbenzoic acid--CoA ligase
MEEKWDAKRFVEHCEKDRITLTSLVPTQLHDLVKARAPAPPGIRAVVIGGSALSKDLGLRAVELGWPVLQTYGMTEACSQIATEPLAHLHSGFDPDILEVLPGWNLETDRHDALYIRGPALASGYVIKRDWRHRTWLDDVRAPQARDLWRWAPIDPASGLVTRDHVQLWWHGSRQFLRFLARGSSFVKVLGELVNLSALQARLDGIAVSLGLEGGSAVVFSTPDERKGSRLVLVGEPPVKQLEALRKRYNKQSTGCERLDECVHVAALPRTTLEKLDMDALRRLVTT